MQLLQLLVWIVGLVIGTCLFLLAWVGYETNNKLVGVLSSMALGLVISIMILLLEGCRA